MAVLTSLQFAAHAKCADFTVSPDPYLIHLLSCRLSTNLVIYLMRRMGTDPAFASIQQMLFEGKLTSLHAHYRALISSMRYEVYSLPSTASTDVDADAVEALSMLWLEPAKAMPS